MCVDGVGRYIVNDEALLELMANPILDYVHKQVIMTLYSMQVNHSLHEYETMLPIYLGLDWDKCLEILKVIEEAGIVRISTDGIELLHQIDGVGSQSCGCS